MSLAVDLRARFDADGADPFTVAAEFAVADGETLVILGPSGSGKSLLLESVAGLRDHDGRVAVDGRAVGDAPPEERGFGFVFQDYALFPHLDVAKNVAFGLDGDGDERVAELLELVDLQGFADRPVDELSGGQQQRVALARALAPEPDVLLLDEPFSNLDVRLRTAMREEVRQILKAAGVTAVSVTHDQEEALSISDRVAVMNDGRVEQAGRPESVFEHPESRFVAGFLGQAGFVSGTLVEGEVRTALGTFHPSRLEGLSAEYDGADLDVLVRPDDLRAVPADDADPARVRAYGTVVHRQYTGPSFVYRVALEDGDVVHCQHNHSTELDLDQRVGVELAADHTLAWYPAP